jgi:hypothetical protein
MSISRPFRSLKLAPLAATSFAVLAAGCKTVPPARAPEPDLQLLNAAPLVIPGGCDASGSFFVSFTVSTTGLARDIRSADAPSCVQEALTAWVESFQYAPPARPVQTGIEWMMVSAKSGS